MKGRKALFFWFMAAIVLLTAGCGGAAAPAAEPAAESEGEQRTLPAVATARGKVIAEGRVEPERWSELSTIAGGEVMELPVQEGDTVTADALLLRVDIKELQNALQSARQDVVGQQAALAILRAGATEAQVARADKENADAIAQAEVALQAARLRLEQAQAEDPATAVEVAEARIRQLNRQLEQIRAQDPVSGVSAAQVVVERAQIALSDAENEYKKALDRPWEDQDIRDGWADQVVQMKLNLRSANAQLAGAREARTANARGLAVVEAQIEEAEIQLQDAQTAQAVYDLSLRTLAADVEAAQLNLEALRTWENPLRDPATEDEIAQAEASLKQAELAVSRLELQIEDAALRAPFAGTVVEVYPELADQVGTGNPVVVLATLDQLIVRTTDLTELDIMQIAAGQPVAVTVDALENRELAGTVSEIALRAGDYRGDVVYEVTVELSDTDAPLRWGMTAMVEIDVR
jgi:multidrug efflux pump subunit AcrA (membrane-fusion protein)